MLVISLFLEQVAKIKKDMGKGTIISIKLGSEGPEGPVGPPGPEGPIGPPGTDVGAHIPPQFPSRVRAGSQISHVPNYSTVRSTSCSTPPPLPLSSSPFAPLSSYVSLTPSSEVGDASCARRI